MPPLADQSRSSPPDHDPGLAGDRTALAWTRSALNIAGSAVLAARAGVLAHLPALGVGAGIAMAAISLLTHRHGLRIYPPRRLPGPGPHHQARAFRLLSACTIAIAAVAAVEAVELVAATRR